MTATGRDPVNKPRATRMSERRTTLIGAMLVAIGPVSMALYTPAMPDLVRAFDSSSGAIKLTLTVYFAGFAVAQLLAGPLSDAFGRRRATMGFLVLYLVGGAIAALASDVGMLIAGRMIQGIGAAVGITVARAIVRDQFIGEQAARIMNMIAIILAVAPAVSPALGGLLLALANWQAIFVTMVGFGVISIAAISLFLQETTVPSRAHARPRMVCANYRAVLRNGEFLSASLACGFAVGTLYALATILPFVMIDVVGLTPTGFGFAMLMQSGSFFLGSVTMRQLMPAYGAAGLAGPGLALVGTGALLLPVAIALFGPNFSTVMVPVAFVAFGNAFLMPHLQIAALMPFPYIAGSASAMMGFIQMGSGLLGGTAAALIGHPVASLVIVMPCMLLVAIGGYVWHRRIHARRRAALSHRRPVAR